MTDRARRLRVAGVAVSVLLAAYLASYLALRNRRVQVWEHDGQAYVLFPTTAAYYVYRPLSLMDGALTGMRFHIGPHR